MIDFGDLERRNRTLNAFLDWDKAAQGGAGPLAGVTVGVKANIMVRGLPWHAGLAEHRSRIADRDAATVAALRDAGAAILGTLNMEEAALGAKTDNPHFGATHNPHRPGFSPGGSSGGSGAAVAAGLCDIALGTDTMGSIQIPAAHCGVYGFKPATGRVNSDGLDPADLALDAIGPLARDLGMLERAATVISKLGSGQDRMSGAVLVDHGVEVAEPVEAAFREVLAILRLPPAQVSLANPNSRIRFAGFIQVAKTMGKHLARTGKLSAHLRRLLSYGSERSEDRWVEDRAILAATRAQVSAIVARHGFLIMPTVPNLPFAHTDAEPAGQADFTCLANIAGLPALSLPAGWSADGLPIGVQIVGRAGHEAGLFALARFLDTELGAYRAPSMQGA